MARQRVITRELAAGSAEAAEAFTPRDDFVVHRRSPGDGGATTFEQAAGPLAAYSRRVDDDGAALTETTSYLLDVPWFGWLFGGAGPPVLRRRAPPGAA